MAEWKFTGLMPCAKWSMGAISFNDGRLFQFTVEETQVQRAKWLFPGDTARKGQGQDVN